MSDSQTNADVEDVLSSIRRLVSDTAAHERDGKDHEKPARSDALLLTSAQRVSGTARAEDAADQNAAESSLTNLRDAVGDKPGVETQAEAQAEKGVDWAAIAADEYYEDVEVDADSPVVDFIRHTPSAQDTNAEPDVEPVEAEDTPNIPEEPWSPQLVSNNDFSDDALDPPDWIESGHADIDDAAVAEAEIEDDIDAVAGEDLAQEAVFASAAAASVLPDVDDMSEEGGENFADFDESVIDEDALRDIVAQIVREELTGELGERITRNVRKLVRREIHRALVTREFE